MTCFTSPKIWAAVLVGSLSSTTAIADISAEDVWTDWGTYMRASGLDLSGTTTRSENTLKLTDILLVSDMPEEDVKLTLSLGEITFSEPGDGTVNIVLPSTLPVTLTVEEGGEDPVTVVMSYKTTDWLMNVTDQDDAVSYTYSASTLGLTVDELTVEGETLPMSALGIMEIALSNLAGRSQAKSEALYSGAQNITTGPLTYTVDVADPDGDDGRLIVKGGVSSMTSDTTFAMPLDSDLNDMSEALENGFAVHSTIGFTGGNLDINFNEDGEIFQMKTSSSANDLGIKMDGAGLDYSLFSKAQNITIAGTGIPFPIEISAEDNGVRVQMPVTPSDEEQPFGMDVVLENFVMSDLIWGIFDPAGQLPRDPATVSLALAGKAKLFLDILDADGMAALDGGEQPGELNSLEVKDLTLRAAGAELLGTGAFTFDNSDLTTFNGVPAPTGKLDLSLSGGNGLLDKLVGMGLIPDQEATGVRMMMGLFAVPGPEPDTLNSTIEVQGNGQIFANGQRIQ